jgi:hypothetical protein
VIVPIIDEDRILAFEPKRHPPIAVDLDGPVIRKIALERMQFPTGDIHARNIRCNVQRAKLNRQLSGMGGLDSGFAPGEEELFQTRVPERLNPP